MGDWRVGVFGGIPVAGIDRFADAQIEGNRPDNLPSQAEVRASAKAVSGRDGEGIEHVVLVGINAVVPFAAVEPLEPEPQLQWYL